MPLIPASKGSASANYGTPRHLFDFLNRRFRFDYDALAALDNRMPVKFFSTPDRTYEVKRAPAGGERIARISELDGFTHPWTGRRVFVNPPYRPPGMIARTVTKAILEAGNAEIVVAILPVDTSTAWWQLLIAHAHLEYLAGRPAFIDHETRLPLTNSTVPIVVAQFHPGPLAWKRYAPPRGARLVAT